MKKFRLDITAVLPPKSRISCHQVDQNCLDNEDVYSDVPSLKTFCFKCGHPVCKNCSSKRKYLKYGIQRLCNDCQIEEDGNDRNVFVRTARQCGYSLSHAVDMYKSRQKEIEDSEIFLKNSIYSYGKT